MKQLAIHSLGWGAGLIAFSQLPALAGSSGLTVLPNAQSLANIGSIGLSAEQLSSKAAVSARQLIAQSADALTIGVRSLGFGDSGQDVRILQRYLNDQSLYPYIADGNYGQETADAVAAYQRIRRLPDTGVANETTLKDMGFTFLPEAQTPIPVTNDNASRQPAALLAGNLGPGSSGSDVIALQQQLRYFGIPIAVDGVYGFETEQAVRTYQRVQGLPLTGTADNKTLESMGFNVPNYPYVAAVIADESLLSEVQRFFPDAYVDRNRRGRFINIGNFGDRFPAEARVDAAAARGFTTRVLYSRSGSLFGQ